MSNELVEKTENALSKINVSFTLTPEVIAKMKTDYMDLKINGIDDKAGYALVHSGRMTAKGHRVALDKERKTANRSIATLKSDVDTRAKELSSGCVEIESYCKEQEAVIDAEKELIADEKRKAAELVLQSRVENLAEYSAIHDLSQLKVMSDEMFNDILAVHKIEWDTEQAKLAEEKRIADEKIETDRLAKVAEDKRLADQKIEQDRIAKEQEKTAADLKAKQDKIDDDNRIERERLDKVQAKIDADLKAIADAKQKVIDDKAREEETANAVKIAADKATKDAEDKIEHDRLAKVEADKIESDRLEREEKLRPDKEKLATFAKVLLNLPLPVVKSTEAKKVIASIEKSLRTLSEKILDASEVM